MSYFLQRDLMLEIPRGTLAGFSSVNKFGRNNDVDAAAAEDIWDGGALWVPPTTHRTHAIVSSDAADTAAGTGARTVTLFGLNSSWAEVSETVTLDGTTPVNTVGTYHRIYRMFVASAGSGLKNAGNITATAATDGTVTARITAALGQTLMAIYTVPAGKTAYMTDYYAAINIAGGGAAYADIELYVRPDVSVATSPYQLKHFLNLATTGTSYLRHEFAPYFKITERSDIIMRSATTVNNTDVSAGFDLILV